MIKESHYKWWVLGLLFMNIAVAMVSLEIMSPLYLEISEDVPLTRSEFGVIMGIFHLASPFFTPIGGILVDRVGPRRVLMGALIIVGLAGASRVLMTTSTGMILSMFLIGVGFASVGPTIPKALSSVFSPKNMGKATGAVTAAFGIGNSFALATGATVLSPALGGWQATMLAISAACVLVAVIWFAVYRDKREEEPSDQPAAKSSFIDGIKQVAKVRNVWLLAFYYMLCMVAYWGLLAHLTPTLIERGIANAGFYAATLTGTSVLFNVLGGVISDWIGRRKPVLITCALTLAATIPGMLFLEGIALVAVLIIAGAALGPIIPVSAAMPSEMKGIGRPLVGTAVGFMFMVGNIGSVAGPILLGVLLDVQGSVVGAYMLPMVTLLLALIPVSMINEESFK